MIFLDLYLSITGILLLAWFVRAAVRGLAR